MLDHLLTYRLLIANLLGVVLLGYAFTQGWVQDVIAADHTGIVWVVIAFFLAFQFSLWNRAFKVSHGLNALKRGEPLDINPAKFVEKGAHLEEMPGWMLLIGLIGNVLGIMLSIDNANLGGGDAAASVDGLLGSMGVAFGATIVSGVLGVWAAITYRMLKTATVCMLADHEAAKGESSWAKIVADWHEQAAQTETAP